MPGAQQRRAGSVALATAILTAGQHYVPRRLRAELAVPAGIRAFGPFASAGLRGPPGPLAERLCRTADRIDPTGVCGSRHRLGRGTSAPNSEKLCGKLRDDQNLPTEDHRWLTRLLGEAEARLQDLASQAAMQINRGKPDQKNFSKALETNSGFSNSFFAACGGAGRQLLGPAD